MQGSASKAGNDHGCTCPNEYLKQQQGYVGSRHPLEEGREEQRVEGFLVRRRLRVSGESVEGIAFAG
jgi:hypothetical protein